MKRDENIASMAFAEQPVLNLRRRHADQRSGVGLARDAIGGRIENAGQRPVRGEDRRSRAGERPKARKKMFAAMHDDRAFDERHGADAIGAAMRLRPDTAGADGLGVRRIGETLVGDHIEQKAFGRGEGDEEIRAGDLLMQRLHFGQRQTAHEDMLLLLRAQDARRRHLKRRRARGIQTKRNATQPAIVNVDGQEIGRHGAALTKNRVGGVGLFRNG